MATITEKGSKGHHRFALTVEQEKLNVSNNTSTLRFVFKISPVETGWRWSDYSDGISYTIAINGVEYKGQIPEYGGYGPEKIKSATLIIDHNTDSSEEIDFSFSVIDTTTATYTPGNASASDTLKVVTATSNSLSDLTNADDRKFDVVVDVNSSTKLTGTTIQSITLDETVNSADALTLGCACSNKVTINLINPPMNIVYENSFIDVNVTLKSPETTQHPDIYAYLGRFYITDVKTSNDYKTLTLTAYDGFCKMSGKYIATVGVNTSIQAVYYDLSQQLHEKCGISMVARLDFPQNRLIAFPYLDITYQQAIGYLAGCFGGFARFNADNKLEIATYKDSGLVIDGSMQYMNGFKRLTENPLRITSIKTGTKEKTIVRGDGSNGTEISFENPYITDALADEVYNNIYGMTYSPCQVKWRGNLATRVGDIVHVVDNNGDIHNVLVMNQQIKIGGGLNSTIDCKGKSQTTSSFSNNFESVGQKLDRIYKTLEQRILDATNLITGNKGGYVVLNDTNGDGKPDEILVMDYEEINAATKVWRWNKEGLGYAYNPSGNAYAGPYRTAITSDGQINADFITTGTLNAERIAVETHNNVTGLLTDYIHFGDGTMTFGKGDSALTLKLENNQVAFYSGENRIAYFSNNSFEIENLTNGKIRFQNFGFIPRASGNLTFTKLI